MRKSTLYGSILLYLSLIFCAQLFFIHHSELIANEVKNPFRPTVVDGGNTFSASEQIKATTYQSWLMRIVLIQQTLKLKMTRLVSDVKKKDAFFPLMMLMSISFAYGSVHAAGPGHGKAVATSYILSRDPSFPKGLLFGSLIAFFHGFSGVVCVMALHFILQKGFNSALHQMSDIIQVVSYGLIILLGSIILVKHSRAYLRSRKKPIRVGESLPLRTPLKEEDGGEGGEGGGESFRCGLIKTSTSGNPVTQTIPVKTTPRRLIPCAFIVGMIPCPAVVTVMLFCLSMDLPFLGILMATAVSLGMAFTISLTVIVVMMGKAGSVVMLSEKHRERMEMATGILSGTCVTALGLLLFISATLH